MAPRLHFAVLAVTVVAAVQLGGAGARAQGEQPVNQDIGAPVEEQIVEPVGVPDDPYDAEAAEQETGASEEPGEPGKAPPPAVAPQENTVAMCGDRFDNDGDGHLDCDDQDCEIFAICVKPAAAPESQPPPQAAPVDTPTVQPRPDPEGPSRRYRAQSASTRPSRKNKVFLIVANATFWPGLLITGISVGTMIHQGGDSCGGGDFFGVCTSWFAVLGGALMVAGIVTFSIFLARNNRSKSRSPGLVLAPLVGDEYAGVGGVLVF